MTIGLCRNTGISSLVAQMVKKPLAHPGDIDSIPGLYSCLEDFMDRRAWWATVHGDAKLNMTEQQKLSLSVASRYAVEPETENQLRKKKKTPS